MSRKVLYREYDEDGQLIKLECSHCHEIKTVDNFHKCETKKDGYVITCKLCTKEYHHQHKEELKENQLRYCEKHKEERKEYQHQYYENHKEEMEEYYHQYRENHKEYYYQYRENHKEEKKEYQRQHHEKHKEKINERHRQRYEEKVNQEIIKIYKKVTKKLYPNNGIQYGIIYGVHCKSTDRWYIGQTIRGFKTRYWGSFFHCKDNELSEENPKLQLLQEDIEKYGQENFEIFEVIDVAFSEKELDEKEAYYIDYYKAYDEGYNSNRGNIFKHNKSKRKEVV